MSVAECTEFSKDMAHLGKALSKLKKKLNEIFRYKKIECLEEYEYIFLKHWFKRNTNIVTNKNQKDLLKIYNRVFGTKKNTSSCSSCVRSMVKELEKIYNNYK